MSGFEAQEEVFIDTPFGRPSDKLRRWHAGGTQGSIPGAPWARSPNPAFGVEFQGKHLRHEIAGRRAHRLPKRGSSLKEEHRPLDFVVPDQFYDRTRGRVSTFFGKGWQYTSASPTRCAPSSQK